MIDRIFVVYMKAMPIFLDSIFPSWAAILISATLVLAISEVKFLFSVPPHINIVETHGHMGSVIYLLIYFL